MNSDDKTETNAGTPTAAHAEVKPKTAGKGVGYSDAEALDVDKLQAETKAGGYVATPHSDTPAKP